MIPQLAKKSRESMKNFDFAAQVLIKFSRSARFRLKGASPDATWTWTWVRMKFLIFPSLPYFEPRPSPFPLFR